MSYIVKTINQLWAQLIGLVIILMKIYKLK
jgi:hypothetical protein